MDASGDTESLTGKLLVAMPGMADPRFERSVVLICAHSDEGAMGIVVNRALPEIGFSDLLSQLGITRAPAAREIAVRFGGPVEPGRGFVLHPRDPDRTPSEGQLAIDDRLAVTTTRDILEDLARGEGPDMAVLTLGYAGWGPGQLEAEMLANGWLIAERDDAILFGREDAGKWASALRHMGVNPSLLSAAAGHA